MRGGSNTDAVDGFSLSPSRGLANRSTNPNTTLKPAGALDGMTFTQTASGFAHSLAIASDGDTYAWGWDMYGTLGTGSSMVNSRGPIDHGWVRPLRVKTPPGVHFTQVSAGFQYSLALGDDHCVYAFGRNLYGELGNSTNMVSGDPNPTPVKITSGSLAGATITSISAGADYAMALDNHGHVHAWGDNEFGVLGVNNGFLSQNPTPVLVNSGSLANATITQISAGSAYSLALDNQGHVHTWGGYHDGSGVTVKNPTPSLLNTGSLTNATITRISAGDGHLMALDTQGHLHSWGMNFYGELGNAVNVGLDIWNPTPTLISSGSIANVTITQMSGNVDFSVALDSQGHVHTWGNTYQGRLGLGNINGSVNVASPIPTQVTTGTLANVKVASLSSSACDSESSLVIDQNGKIHAWGHNGYGQLGDVSTQARWSFVPVRTGNSLYVIDSVNFDGSPVSQKTVDTATGSWEMPVPSHPAGIVPVTVTYHCGGLLVGTVIYNPLPVETSPTETVTLHYEYKGTYRVDFDLGEGSGQATGPGYQEVMSGDPITWPTDPTWAGHQFTGWFKADGSPWNLADPVTGPLTLTAHWNYYSFTMTPISGPVTGNTPVTIKADHQPTTLRFTQISTGSTHVLAIGSDGNTYAWGSNAYGQLGDGTRNNIQTPSRVLVPDGVHFIQVSAGGYSNFSLALGDDHNVYAWGDNTYGELGDSVAQSLRPRKITTGSLPAGAMTQVSAGSDHSLALDNQGHVYAWGSNFSGELGNTANNNLNAANPTPTLVNSGSLSGATITQIGAGASHSLALDTQGHIHAWGNNRYGQLGTTTHNGTDIANPTPAIIASGSLSGATIKQIDGGSSHSLALDTQGHIHAWGNNYNGELGNPINNTIESANPSSTIVNSGSLNGVIVTQVSADNSNSMALDAQGRIHVWGNNYWGQLGTATNSSSMTPNPTPVIAAGGSLNGVTISQISVGTYYSMALDSLGRIHVWGCNTYGELGNDTTDFNVNSTPVMPLQTGKVTISSVEFGDNLHTCVPTYNRPREEWTGKTPSHVDGHVPVNIHWKIAGVAQPDFNIASGFLYYTFYTLPGAGTIPLHRQAGTLLLALTCLSACAYAAHQLSQHRKRLAQSVRVNPLP
ncbi:hypothetical protein KIM372_03890 [Bombiscardovia nodaiensis]|uniref:RCC1-like domain-containing protein n=1 Tax=Bombiscardovia nodaiensis TaxID=2932181 RepID=A0ABN6S8L6_9BIFI|nr:hypothetical protein KIM372_03890 [Bombiscardovia nodaiensis]